MEIPLVLLKEAYYYYYSVYSLLQLRVPLRLQPLKVVHLSTRLLKQQQQETQKQTGHTLLSGTTVKICG